MAKKLSKIDEACKRYADLILSGTMLAIDPGSTNNLGWAFYESGELRERGVFKAKYHKGSWHRLRQLSKLLSDNFPYVDVLAVEHVAMGRVQKNARLLSSVGMVFVSVDSEAVVMVPPISWLALLPDKDAYRLSKKAGDISDDEDAENIGNCVIYKARNVK